MSTFLEDVGSWINKRGTELGHSLSGTVNTDDLKAARDNGTYAQAFNFNDPALEQQRRQAFLNATMANAARQQQVDGRGVPMAGAVDNAQADWRNQQMVLASQLQAAANGQGPSLATAQMGQGLNQAMQQAQAMGASVRGDNPLRGIRMAGAGFTDMASNIAGQAGMARMQEQLAARDQLAGVLNAGRSGDFQHAGMLQQNELANQNAQLQARGQNDAFTQFLMNRQSQTDQSFYNDQMNKKLAQAQENQWQQNATNNAMMKQATNNQGFVGGLFNQAGGILTKAAGL